MPRAVAINVGANTNLPGVRGPIYPDGRFEYLPIPEREPVGEEVPTYADLDLDTALPEDILDTAVHLDPTFAEYACCDRYTYGDDYGVKARPLLELAAGDYVFFYATLSTTRRDSEMSTGRDESAPWIAPEWGAYVIGQFRLARDPISAEEYGELPPADRAWFDTNAHVRRERFDAEVMLAGDPEESMLYDQALPLSTAEAGSDANRVVTELSSDSGKGPWWRRPMRFQPSAVEELLEIRENDGFERCFR
ncbi:hypothetical protein [Natranaeroarchaeum aerophilus]|uniref:Nucleotide modification associated domain-containing protein n=1 Tax=Natranaeroarchaeum aerophilus TaxID=2917711 RepID=A0AAE3FPB2_9EURY|nr:hypothetical protein [Natranaeroarchaeum aerophilus]